MFYSKNKKYNFFIGLLILNAISHEKVNMKEVQQKPLDFNLFVSVGRGRVIRAQA